MLIRGIIYIAGKWYGMEPLHTSRTFEHRFYQLEDMQHIPFHCGVLNDSLHHEMQMFVKQSVKYAFSLNSTSSREELLRVNTFLFLSWGLQSKLFPQSVPVAKALQSLVLAWYHCRWVWLSTSCCSRFRGPQTVGSSDKFWKRRIAQWESNITWSSPLAELSPWVYGRHEAAIQLMHLKVWPKVKC